MPLSEDFDLVASLAIEGRPMPRPVAKPRRKRPAPFSIRLSEAERSRLLSEAAGAPLGSYIKAKLTGSALPIRRRRTGLAVEDRTALAKALALLGSSRISSNLNQLAHLGNVGALAMTPETDAELLATLEDVRAIRRLIMSALGLKPEDGP